MRLYLEKGVSHPTNHQQSSHNLIGPEVEVEHGGRGSGSCVPARVRRGGVGTKKKKQEATVPADDPIGAVSRKREVARGDRQKRRRFLHLEGNSPQVLESSQRSIDRGPPAHFHRSPPICGRREKTQRQSPAARCGGWSSAEGWMVELKQPLS